MSDVDLMDDELEAPKKRRGLPKWLLGCGCGCTILIIALSVLGLLALQEMADPEKQWPALRQNLYFEERPTEIELAVGMSIPFSGIKQYTLVDKQGEYTVNLYVFADPNTVEAYFMTEGKGLEKLAVPNNAKLGETEVQGRMVRSMTDTGLSVLPEGLVGPGIRIDISTENRYRVLELRVNKGKTALSDGEISEFFSMFDVWHE